jgi:hypothetical protein
VTVPGINAFAAERIQQGGDSPLPPWLEDLGESDINLLQSMLARATLMAFFISSV